jgi:hypothetical protein
MQECQRARHVNALEELLYSAQVLPNFHIFSRRRAAPITRR